MPEVVFYALDKNGQVPLHREAFKILTFPGKAGEDSLKAAVEQMIGIRGKRWRIWAIRSDEGTLRR